MLCLSCGARSAAPKAPEASPEPAPRQPATGAAPDEPTSSSPPVEGAAPGAPQGATAAGESNDGIAPAAPDSDQLGTSGPIAVEAVAPDGRWVAYCQPTQDTNGDGQVHVTTNARGEVVGDALDVFLALGASANGAPTSPPERIDELLAYDATGRWLVLRNDDRVFLLDTSSGARVDLTPLAPDVRSDEAFEIGHRSFAFDDAAKQLLVLSHRGRFRYEAHLLALPEDALPDPNRARKVTLPAGETWRVELSGDGAHAIVKTMLHDPAKNASYQWPAPLRNAPIRRCRGPFTQAGAWAHRGGEITTLLASTTDLVPQAAPGFVMPLRGGWLRRERNGRLLLVRGGTQKQVASERCGARVLHADTKRDLFLVSCEHYALEKPKVEETKSAKGTKRKSAPPKFRFELYLVAPGFVKDLEADLPATNYDRPPGDTPTLVPLRPGARNVLLDLEQRRLFELPPDDRILAVHEQKALVRRGTKLVLFDAKLQKEREIATQVKTFPELLVAGRFVFVEPYLVDLADGTVRLEHRGAPLALTQSGHLLVPAQESTLEAWARGPLRWLDAANASDEKAARRSAR